MRQGRRVSDSVRFVAAVVLAGTGVIVAVPPAQAQATLTSTPALGLADPSLSLPQGLLEPLLPSADHGVDLSIFGFADFTFSRYAVAEDSLLDAFIPRNSAFYVGNLNTYIRSSFDEFTLLMEVRFLYEPNGSTDRFSGDFQEATATDHADLYRRLKYGAIEIERAWLEWEIHPLFGLRVGQWLTPYGIWNVDHGSPTVIAVRRPYTIAEELFPERQAGLQAFGSAALGALDLSYTLTVSNGRGPFDAYLDLDDNKALGGRVAIEYSRGLEFELGASAYYGRFTDESPNVAPDPERIFIARPSIDLQYDELALAADLQVRVDGLRFQAEVISNQRWYTTAGRPTVPFDEGALYPDEHVLGMYGLLAYDTGFLGVMPYVLVEVNRQFANVLRIHRAIGAYGGLNIRLHPRVTFKLQATYLALTRTHDETPLRVGIFDSQVACAF